MIKHIEERLVGGLLKIRTVGGRIPENILPKIIEEARKLAGIKGHKTRQHPRGTVIPDNGLFYASIARRDGGKRKHYASFKIFIRLHNCFRLVGKHIVREAIKIIEATITFVQMAVAKPALN